MRCDLIKKVTLRKLAADKYDRRGTIATFDIAKVPAQDYAISSTVMVIQKITALLNGTYRDHSDSADDHRRYEPLGLGEQNDSWISLQDWDSNRTQVALRHKYWTDQQVEAFRQIIRALAILHRWELVDLEE